MRQAAHSNMRWLKALAQKIRPRSGSGMRGAPAANGGAGGGRALPQKEATRESVVVVSVFRNPGLGWFL